MINNAKVCEIALIAGVLSERGVVNFHGRCLDEMYEFVYLPIMEEWVNGIKTGILKNKEEEGYISAYAQRVLVERYKA